MTLAAWGGGRWRGLGLLVLSTGLLFYGGLALLTVVLTPRSLFPVPPVSYFDDDPDLRKIELPNGDRVTVLTLPRPDARYVLLYAHGNREDLGRIRGRLEDLRQAGFTVVAFDYPGYGTSTGRPSESGVYASMNAVFRFLVDEMEVAPSMVVLYGKALGGAAVVELAGREEVGGVILENVPMSAFRLMPILRLLPWDHIDSLSRMGEIMEPVWVIHGQDDQVVPLTHGEALLAATRAPKLFLWVDEAGHDDVAAVAGETYWEVFQDFMFRVEALPPP